jgi:hypothetical protein
MRRVHGSILQRFGPCTRLGVPHGGEEAGRIKLAGERSVCSRIPHGIDSTLELALTGWRRHGWFLKLRI